MCDHCIYYEEQAGWTTIDRQGLCRYLNLLFQSLGSAPVAARSLTPSRRRFSPPDGQERRRNRSARPLASVGGHAVPDEDMLVHTGHYEMALTRFPNLPRRCDDPTYVYLYYTEHGILL